MKFLGILAIFFLSLNGHAETETFKFPASSFQKIKIHNAFGDVHMAPAIKNEIVVVANKRKWGTRCLLNIDSQSAVFDVEVSDKSWLMDNECRLDLVISLPPRLSVHVSAGVGNIDVIGTRGELSVEVGSGKINVNSDLKRLTASSGTGTIRFAGSAENSQIKTGVGDIFLEMKEKVEGRIVAQSGTGDVFISLDEKSKVHAKTSTGNGYIKNAFPNANKKADLDIEVTSGSGDVQIREN